MRIIAVDDEPLVVKNVLRLLEQLEPTAELFGFTEPEDAFALMEEKPVDIAFLDIEMGEINGIALAKKCQNLCPEMNIIFLTGYSQYALDALELHASGYLMKPVRADNLRKELDNLRHPLPPDRRVKIQTFGNFEVFVDGKLLRVPRQKCKECLAYLVDRKGAGVTFAQLSSVLWEEQPISSTVQKNTHKIISALWKALGDVDAADILIRTHVDIALDTGKVDCDYFKAISGDMVWMKAFAGEYMTNYSWAEFTLGELIEIRQRSK